jgi:dihydropyrimidinase
MKTFILNGTVVFEQKVEISDIEITDDKITQIGKGLVPTDDAVVIDATDKHVFPGIIDFHAHFQESVGPFTCNETYTSGSLAAILNGVTTANCFITQNFNQSLGQVISSAMDLAAHKIYTDIRWHLTPTRFSEANISDIGKWVERGFNTFKFYTTYKNLNLYIPYDKLLELVKRLGVYEPTIMIHCEDDAVMHGARFGAFDAKSPTSLPKLRNEEAEMMAVEKIIEICKISQIDIVIAHVSSSDAIGMIELAKRDCPIMCEVTPPHVFLNENKYFQDVGYRYSVYPPLRGEECRRLLSRKILLDYCEIISSNHRSYSKELLDRSKSDIRNVPQGIPSIGALFHLFTDLFMNKSDFPLHLFWRKMSSNPARLAGIYPRKGVIAIDSDADILVVNLNGKEREIYGTLSNSYNPWEGMMTKYNMDYVFLRGVKVVENDQIVDKNMMTGEILTK